MQRHTIFREITCIANRKRRSFCYSVQRHTIFREIPCVAKGKPLPKKNNRRPTKKVCKNRERLMQTLSSQGREKELFHHGQFSEVVVMFSLGDQFGREAGLLRVECKGVEVYIEPVERFSEDVLVLHLIV